MPRSLLERRSPSLHRRLILLLLAVGLLPLLIVTMLNNLQGARVLTELANAQLAELAVSSLEKINRDVYDRYGDVQAFASSEAARSMDAPEITALMTRMTTIYAPAYRLMLVADSSGVLIAASQSRSDGSVLDTDVLLGTSAAGEPWFAPWQRQQLPSGTTLIQDMYSEPRVAALYGDGGYVVGFSHGIFDQRGTLIGVWVNLIDWHGLGDLLAEAEQRPHRQGATSVRLNLVNHVGLLLGGATTAQPMQASYVPPALSLVQSAQSSSYGGRDFGLNWVVIATQERGEALATARLQTLQTLLLALALSGLVVLVGLLAARVITRPLKSLQRATERVAQGDLLASVPGGPGEIGQVALAFNSMTAQLRTLYSNLEQQVTTRTAELETALQHLQQRSAELQTSQDQLSASNQTLAESELRYRTLFERSQTMLNETEMLYRIARSLIASEQLETLLQLVVDGVVEALDASAVALITLDSAGSGIADFVRGGVDRELIDTVSFAELSDGLFGWILRTAQPVLSPSQPPDLREAPVVRQRRAARGTGSIIAAPLAYRGRVLGVMTAFNRHNQREWTARDLTMLTAVANQAAVVLQNARLYASLQQELAERRRAEDELHS